MNFQLLIANPANHQFCTDPLGSPRRTRGGAWRILFFVDTEKRLIEVRAIRPRGQVYRVL